jgi:hypothetical protein
MTAAKKSEKAQFELHIGKVIMDQSASKLNLFTDFGGDSLKFNPNTLSSFGHNT